jgi:hypothetical protein
MPTPLSSTLDGASTITTVADLDNVIAQANSKGSGSYVIELGDTSIALTQALTAIDLQTGVTLDIEGNGATINGESNQRGLFVYSGTVTVENLTVTDAIALGANGASGGDPYLEYGGGGGGGGGAGLGGGLFVGSGASVVLTDVGFSNDKATGGNGGSAGGPINSNHSQGVGGAGGNFNGSGGGSGGPVSFAHGASPGGAGGDGAGGGGGAAYTFAPGAGGGAGGFGGGGAGGGGGSASAHTGGAGGAGGFGAGSGQAAGPGHGLSGGEGGGGGGGLGAGGDIFVQSGGSLTISGGSLANGTATGGTGTGGGGNGQGDGAGIFIEGNQSISFGIGQTSSQSTTIGGVITDQSGSDPTNIYNDPGHGRVIIAGAGTVVLDAANTYTGGTTLDAGTLELAASGAAGSGPITFVGAATLKIDAAALPASGGTFVDTIDNFTVGDAIDIAGLMYKIAHPNTITLSGDTLTVSNGTATYNFTFGGTVPTSVANTSDGSGGTEIVAGNTNLITDGNFNALDLADPASSSSIQVDPINGNYTGTNVMMTGWTSSGGSFFAPTSAVSPAFAGTQVAYLFDNATMSQSFATGTAAYTDQYLITLDVGTRLDQPATSGSVLITASIGGQQIGSVTFNAASSTPGGSTQLSFVTTDLDSSAALAALAGQDVTLSIQNDSNNEVLIGDVVAVATIAPNLIADGNFQQVDLATGASGVTAPTNGTGNFTGTAPTGWTGSSAGDFAPTALDANSAFVGSDVAYVNQGAQLSQTFTAPVVTLGP